jgi:hypothetical protein
LKIPPTRRLLGRGTRWSQLVFRLDHCRQDAQRQWGAHRNGSPCDYLLHQALRDVGLADDSALGEVLHDYFAWAITTTMSRYQRSA